MPVQGASVCGRWPIYRVRNRRSPKLPALAVFWDFFSIMIFPSMYVLFMFTQNRVRHTDPMRAQMGQKRENCLLGDLEDVADILKRGRFAGGLLRERQHKGNRRPNRAQQKGQIGLSIDRHNIGAPGHDHSQDQEQERGGPNPSNQQHHDASLVSAKAPGNVTEMGKAGGDSALCTPP